MSSPDSICLKYLSFAREKPCCVCGGQAEPHHLKAVGMGRNRKKPMPEHYTVVPLCREHHTRVHSMGMDEFQKRFRVVLWKVAALLVAEYFWDWEIMEASK